MKTFTDKHVLITGGSSGIGLALAKLMAADGAHVWILARRLEQLENACQEITASCKKPTQKVGIIQADIADRDHVTRVLHAHTGRQGVPDVLVNGAGITYPGMFAELPLDIFDQMMKVNYEGTLNVTKALLPGMISRRSGHVAIIGSLAGVVGLYGYSAYGASKFALRGLADVLRVELREHNISTSYIIPVDTDTPQLEFEKNLKPPVTTALASANSIVHSPEEVAQIIFRGLARGKYIITTGSDAGLLYSLSNSFGIVYPVMDILLRQAFAKVQSAKNGNSK